MNGFVHIIIMPGALKYAAYVRRVVKYKDVL